MLKKITKIILILFTVLQKNQTKENVIKSEKLKKFNVCLLYAFIPIKWSTSTSFIQFNCL